VASVAVMLERMAVRTPEGVAVSVPLAGLGSRFTAGIVDLTIQLIILSLVGWVVSVATDIAGRAAGALSAILSFLVLFFYPVLFEVRWAGRTPGKRLNGLRVVSTLGGPVTLRASVTRNLVRVIDFLPMLYAIGMFTLVAGSTQQRLGDIAAGTVVTFEPKKDSKNRRMQGGYSVRLPGPEFLATIDVSGVSTAEITAVRQFLDRRPDLPWETRHALAMRFAQPLRARVNGIPPYLSDEHFLEAISIIKGQRA
jgi:uncharacterized RDD family membrane protein YckC